MKTLFAFLALFVAAVPLLAQSPDESAIRSVLTDQQQAWNQGDIPAFMKSYEDSPQTTFIGATMRKGFQPILERYQHAYSSPAQMGKLTFSDIDIRLLPGSCGKTEFAVVTGHFHLARTDRQPGSKDEGIFSLVWRKGEHGWKILLDHTS